VQEIVKPQIFKSKTEFAQLYWVTVNAGS